MMILIVWNTSTTFFSSESERNLPTGGILSIDDEKRNCSNILWENSENSKL